MYIPRQGLSPRRTWPHLPTHCSVSPLSRCSVLPCCPRCLWAPFLLCCQNGAIILRAAELQPPYAPGLSQGSHFHREELGVLSKYYSTELEGRAEHSENDSLCGRGACAAWRCCLERCSVESMSALTNSKTDAECWWCLWPLKPL